MCYVNASGDLVIFIWWPLKHFLHSDVVLQVNVSMSFFLAFVRLQKGVQWGNWICWKFDYFKGSLKCDVYLSGQPLLLFGLGTSFF